MNLFTPFQIRNLQLKNRIVMSPMCMHACPDQSGNVNDWHRIHYATRAVGQVGLIIVEATAVTPQGRISPQDLGIWDDEHIAGLRDLTRLVHEQGSAIAIQLAHAGRKAVLDGPIIAPSAIPFDANSKSPQVMSKEQIEETIDAFVQGAYRAIEAGFDVLEIHAAHGYLINQFLSPLTNHRNDEYGGDRERRYRFLGTIIDRIRKSWDGPLFVRISANEYHPEGNQMEDLIDYAQRMKQQGVDLIDCSTGGVIPVRVDSYPGYQVPYAEQIKQAADIATGAVGLITAPEHADAIIRNGRADLVLLGRELLRDPYWPRRAAEKLGIQLESPIPYRRGW